MKTWILFLLLITCVSAQQQPDIPWPSLMQSQSPMIKMHPTLHGRVSVTGPQSGSNIYMDDAIAGIFSGPVLDLNDQMYFGSYRGRNAFIRYGYPYSDTVASFLPNYSPNEIFSGAPLLGADGTIFFGSEEGYIYALNSDLSIRSSYLIDTYFGPLSGMNIDLNGNVYITGENGTLYCVSPAGTLVWSAAPQEGLEPAMAAFAPNGETLYAAGKDSCLYAFNLDGTEKWRFHSGPINHSPVVDAQGNIYVLPDTTPLIFYSLFPDGTIRWQNILSGSAPDKSSTGYESAPAIDKDGNITVFGYGGGADYSLFSFNWDGSFRWEYNFSGTYIAQPLICDAEGTIYCGGTMGDSLFAVSNLGTMKWSIALNGFQVDNTGAFTSEGNLVLGVHSSFDNYNGLWIISDDPLSADDETPAAENFSLRQNYPNPFNPSTVITYTLAERTNVSLVVYDVLGTAAATLAEGEQDAGTHSVVFNAGQLSSGVYFYTLTAGGFRASQKMLFVK